MMQCQRCCSAAASKANSAPVCCSVLQCVTMCCSVNATAAASNVNDAQVCSIALQCIAVWLFQ